MVPQSPSLALILSGGNALGAYQAGAYQALHERGLEPDWVAGASAGALNGAILCGNPPGERLARLSDFWRPAGGDARSPWRADAEAARRTAAAGLTLALGQPGLFTPRRLLGPFWEPFGNPEPSSLYDTSPLRATLERLIDFDLLNRGTPRFSATAVDLDSGEDLAFDTRAHRISADHLRASAALLPVFPPIEIGGRMLGDAGMSANLPLDVVLSDLPEGDVDIVAVDLLPLEAPRPASLGDSICRAQDLVFATQSRRAVAAWQAIFAARHRAGEALPRIRLLHLAYSDQSLEVSGKAFDFSSPSAAARWAAGYRDLGRALDGFQAASAAARPGLTVYRPEPGGDGGLREASEPLAPRPFPGGGQP